MSEPGDKSVTNRMSGSFAGNNVQIGAVHGNVIWRSRGAVILIVATLLGALGAGVGVALVTFSSASTQESAAGPDSDPVSVTVELLTDMCLVSWVVPKPATEIDLSAPMSTNYNWRAWEPTKNGISAGPAYVRVTVQGRSQAQVVLTGIRVQVHERRPPPVGTALRGQCGDRGALRWLRVDLDVEPPRILPVLTDRDLPGDPPWERQPIKFPYRVSLSDAEVFLIEANTGDCVCAWTAELSWASQGRTGTAQINDHGEWLRTSSTKGMAHCAVYTMPDLKPTCAPP